MLTEDMTINTQTRISTILRKSPLALYAIVQLSPKFNKLRNPILRKVMAPRVNIAQAAKIGGCKPENFFSVLKPLGFIVSDKPQISSDLNSTEEKPQWLINAGENQVKLLDVRPILEGKQDPLNHILDSLKMLSEGEILCVLNSFEPTPLMHLLGKKGYVYHVEKMRDDEVFTYFKAGKNKVENELAKPGIPTENNFAETLKKYFGKLEEIDVRTLEMPGPMLIILEKLDELAPSEALFVNHKRLPVYLLPELEDRGFAYQIKEIAEGDVKMLIYRK